MAVRLRLQRQGRKQAPFYHIVASDARTPRDGRYLERIGTYNPLTRPATIEIDRDRAFYWIMNGAQPTDTVAAILRFKGVMYRKHLARGVKKGALTQEKADEMFNAWVEAKEGQIEKRREQTKREAEEYHKKIFGTPRAKKVVEAPVEETPAEDQATEETASEETAAEE